MDPKNKTASLERVSVASVEGNLPVFLASYKNHASFAINFANNSSSTIVKPAGFKISRRHIVFGRDSVLLSGSDPSQKEENIYFYNMANQSTQKIEGIDGDTFATVPLTSEQSKNGPTAACVVVATSTGFFALTSKGMCGTRKMKSIHNLMLRVLFCEHFFLRFTT